MNYQITLSPDLRISPEELVAAWDAAPKPPVRRVDRFLTLSRCA